VAAFEAWLVFLILVVNVVGELGGSTAFLCLSLLVTHTIRLLTIGDLSIFD